MAEETRQEEEVKTETAETAEPEEQDTETAQTPEEETETETESETAEETDAEDDGDDTETSEEPGEEPAENKSGKQTWAEKKAAKKQAKLDKKTDAMKEQIDQLEDKVKRQLAEFENFRNRSEREKQAMFETGARSVIEKILPIVDNFERGFATVDEEDQDDAFVTGMQSIYKQLTTELEKMGVKPIEAVGKEFDPNLHNAVMQVESEEYGSGIVAQELQKGYTYHDTVVRHSMVAVVP